MEISTVGEIVQYKLTASDATLINQARDGNQRHGNYAQDGDVYPLLVTRVWGTHPGASVNGQVFTDGNDNLWVTSRIEGDAEGQFTRVRQG